MKHSIFTRTVITLIWTSMLVGLGYYFIQPAKVVQALGTLTITLPSSPLFSITNWLPGDTATKQFQVENTSSDPQQLAIRVSRLILTPPDSTLPSQIDIIIHDTLGNYWYGTGSLGGQKTMSDFNSEVMVFLGAINPGVSKTYIMDVSFAPEAGNNVQKHSLLFDLTFMEEIVGPDGEALPEECSGIVFSGSAIIGTPGIDHLRGDNGNNLMWGRAGNDTIYGYGGNDCIITGPGNDRVWGGTGKDYIFGQGGLNQLDGGSDEDLIIGGPDIDKIDGGSDPDKIYGLGGNDELSGDSGDDRLWGGDGNDLIDAGSGMDFVSGDNGDDKMYGGSSNDRIIGGPGVDWIDGQTGTDTCQAETKLRCEL